MPCAESLRQNGVTATKAIPTYWVANRIYKCKFIYKAHYMKNVDALFEALSLLVGLICERSSVGQSVRLIIERSMVQIHPFAPPVHQGRYEIRLLRRKYLRELGYRG